MLNENRISLARYRLATAKENYEVAVLLFNEAKYKDACIETENVLSTFPAMSAVGSRKAFELALLRRSKPDYLLNLRVHPSSLAVRQLY